MMLSLYDRHFLIAYLNSTLASGTTMVSFHKYLRRIIERLEFGMEDLKEDQKIFVHNFLTEGLKDIAKEAKDSDDYRIKAINSILDKTKKVEDDVPETDTRDAG